MKRKLIILLAIVMVLSGIVIYTRGDNNRYTKDFYNPLLAMPLDTVVERGIDYVYSNKPDSALAYFSVVAGQYNESMSRADKMACAQAYNCKGYVEFFDKRQIGQSLISLLTAERIEKEVEDSTWLPLIYLNMANVLTFTNDVDHVIELNRRTINLAARRKAWRTYLTAFCNLVGQAVIECDPVIIKKDLEKFASLKIPKASLRGFAQCLYEGGTSLLEKRWDDAYDYFQKADSLNDAELTPQRTHVLSVFLRSRVLQLKGEPRLAIKELLDNYDDYEAGQISSACLMLSRLYGSVGDSAQAAQYKLKYYENTDSLGLLASSNQLATADSQFQLNNMTGEVTRLNARRNAWITIAFVCGLSAIILAGALIAVVRSRRRLRKSQDELFLKNKAIISSPVTPQRTAEDGDDARHIMEVLECSPEIFEVGFSLEKAAALTGVHSRRISKILMSAYDKNFNTVLQELRIKEACRLLESPATAQSLNMAGIAARLGFKSRTYFSEVFKKQTGLTPTEYMRSARRAEK